MHPNEIIPQQIYAPNTKGPVVRGAGPYEWGPLVLRPTAQLYGLDQVTPAVGPRTAARAKLTQANLAQATL